MQSVILKGHNYRVLVGHFNGLLKIPRINTICNIGTPFLIPHNPVKQLIGFVTQFVYKNQLRFFLLLSVYQ